ncbi:MAG TPA: GAF domain-containing sensor histidine kinase [Chloroflexota bacterium]|nr:GAF domain-containing sensor histidine kinase [Chloroflexota bacterium]
MNDLGHEDMAALLTQATMRSERLRELGRLSLSALRAQDADEVVSEAAEAARRLLETDRATVRLWDERRQLLVCHCMVGYADNIRLEMLNRRPGEGVAGMAFEQSRALTRKGFFETADPIQHPEYVGLRSAVAAPLLTSTGALGVLTAASLSGRNFDTEDGDLLQQLANLISTALEKARLVEAETEKSRRLETLYQTGRLVSSTLDLNVVLDEIVRAAAMLTGGASGILCLRHEHDDQIIYVAASYGLRSGALEGVQFSEGEGLIGLCVSRGETLVIPDIREDARSTRRDIDEAENFRSLLYAPIKAKGQVIGGLAAGSGIPNAFADDHLQVLLALADHAATSIENARLYQRSKNLAITEERNRLAREIHDTLAQGLTGIILQLELADMILGEHPASPRVLRALELARDNLQEARRSVLDLRAEPLGGQALGEALERLVNEFGVDNVVEARFQVPLELPRFPARVEVGLFRIAQEALTNVRKHARARCVEVILTYDEKDLRLVIRDDGRGFDPTVVQAGDEQGGFGLRGLQERAVLLGGEAILSSAPARGTQVEVLIPRSGLGRTSSR